MSSPIPKAVLYYYPQSIWCSVALLALAEKGYGEDEIDLRVVDLTKGEQFSPTFLRLNPKATVPTLVVPLQKTLNQDVESRYKAITETKDVAEFLDKSRSALSKTHTTSTAPAPALAPATIAFSATSNLIIDELHSDAASPRTLRYNNARDQPALAALAKDTIPKIIERKEALDKYIADSENETIHVSEKVKKFWITKRAGIEILLDVYLKADKLDSELSIEDKEKRDDFFAQGKLAWEVSLKDTLTKLSKEIIGPYALGDQLSLADLHLAGSIARLVKLSGGTASDEGDIAIGKLEAHIGGGFTLPKDFQPSEVPGNRTAVSQSKLAAFWDAMKERPSWKKVFGDGLV